ncbi:hypothetical protein ES705_33822 [subsurface metagenome]
MSITIMGGDDQADIESYIVTICGLDYEEYLMDKKILTQSVFESHLVDIIDFIENSAYSRIAYQVLGYFILKTGSMLPDNIKIKIIESSMWEDELDVWEEHLQKSRKFHLDAFRNSIISHRRGVVTTLLEDVLTTTKKLIF